MKAITIISEPPAPCGYCRRCAIHDDPGGCLEVEAWARENPATSAIWEVIAQQAWERRYGA
jgi:hypothetical protein